MEGRAAEVMEPGKMAREYEKLIYRRHGRLCGRVYMVSTARYVQSQWESHNVITVYELNECRLRTDVLRARNVMTCSSGLYVVTALQNHGSENEVRNQLIIPVIKRICYGRK